MIVAASFLVNMIADGVTFSFGVLFVEFQVNLRGYSKMTSQKLDPFTLYVMQRLQACTNLRNYMQDAYSYMLTYL